MANKSDVKKFKQEIKDTKAKIKQQKKDLKDLKKLLKKAKKAKQLCIKTIALFQKKEEDSVGCPLFCLLLNYY